jgi:Zn-dependent protease
LTRFCGPASLRPSPHSTPRPGPLDSFQTFLFAAPVLLFSMVAHEYAHGYVALKQGDATAYQLGRLTWNPIKHIDPWMTIILPVMLLIAHGPLLGGAKPVPVNPRNFRRFKRGDILVSLAGVTANALIAVVGTAVIPVLGAIGRGVAAGPVADSLGILQVMAYFAVFVNLQLVAFNLLPVPPLDGSHVMKYLLPPAWALQYQRLGFFGLIILVVLLNTQLIAWWLTPTTLLTQSLIGSVDGWFLPSARHWFAPA